MSAAPPPSASKSSVDVRTLSLVQLQMLADRGSRRARAELEGRMRASVLAAQAATAAPARTAPPAADIPTLMVRADAASPRAVPPLPMPMADAAPEPPRTYHDNMAEQLQLMAQQDEARARAHGPPRLVGMVLIGWGVLMLFGALVMLGRGGALYYLFCGAGSAAVGWLLMQSSRWAMVLHGGLLLVAMGWAWFAGGGSVAMALAQAAALWIPALWMLVRPVREPLE
ncbi:hypothetical protein [Ottowia testudinis]|uniref:Uncharacterized protein n=1 Tax=Ottowia testudinis TaxID=2816950 RepID=A0A975CHF3_9BURK|nr:hypothetical protein [Ottowia testudinis]QTD45837.1 hypothetical protein J1M35_02635 [Ottowia testudinis]